MGIKRKEQKWLINWINKWVHEVGEVIEFNRTGYTRTTTSDIINNDNEIQYLPTFIMITTRSDYWNSIRFIRSIRHYFVINKLLEFDQQCNHWNDFFHLRQPRYVNERSVNWVAIRHCDSLRKLIHEALVNVKELSFIVSENIFHCGRRLHHRWRSYSMPLSSITSQPNPWNNWYSDYENSS